MGSIVIAEARTPRERKAFVTFPLDLYAGHPHYVPSLIRDELKTFSKAHNPSFDHAEVRLLLARIDGKTVGRTAGIINHLANEVAGTNHVRFGWFDCVKDQEVAAALLKTIEDWGLSLGTDAITGPHGFGQMDKAGMLVEGFDQMSTMITYYNHPYYPEMVESLGFKKAHDWVEYRLEPKMPERQRELAEHIAERRGFRILEFPDKQSMLSRAHDVLDVWEETFKELTSYAPLSPRQRDYYVDKMFPFLNQDFVKVAVNAADQVIGFFIAMPSVAEALRKAWGRLLPFGIYHLWKAVRYGGGTLDFMLAGVRKEYRGKGVNLLMGLEMAKAVERYGIKSVESSPQLESNRRVRSEMERLKHVQHKRRRLYIKSIS